MNSKELIFLNYFLNLSYIPSSKFILPVFPKKSNEEILKEHRNLNKILKKSLKLSKINKKFKNFYN